MIQGKVDTRFLGTIQNTFYGLPELPQPVRMFLTLIVIGLLLLAIRYFIRKYRIFKLVKDIFNEKMHELAEKIKSKKETEKTPVTEDANQADQTWRGETDHDILEKLVMNRGQADIFGERSGQRTLAAVINFAGIEGMDVVATFKDMVTEELLAPGTEIKCVFEEMFKGEKRINAFVGKIKSYSPDKGMVITRTTSFGYIKRRVFARRKVADQRYIKIKVWRLEDENFDVEHILDSVQPDMKINNQHHLASKTSRPHVVDISKGGLALIGSATEGGNVISRNDRVLIAMLIYMPDKKTFQPHLIYAETRAARSMGIRLTRMSFQFLRSIKVPPRKRSTLFKGQAVMAMELANPE